MWKMIILTVTAAGMDIQAVDFQTREACMQTLRAFNSPETYEGEQIDFDMPITRGWCVDDAPFEGDGERNFQRVWK
jgi:succinyl-CoA synthetase beta subunit